VLFERLKKTDRRKEMKIEKSVRSCKLTENFVWKIKNVLLWKRYEYLKKKTIKTEKINSGMSGEETGQEEGKDHRRKTQLYCYIFTPFYISLPQSYYS